MKNLKYLHERSAKKDVTEKEAVRECPRLEMLLKMRNVASRNQMWTSLCALMTSCELVEACRAPTHAERVVVERKVVMERI